MDGEKSSLSANYIAENLFTQIDDDGNRQVLLNEIIDHCTTGRQVMQQDAFIMAKKGVRRRKETTTVWEILVQWKDGSTKWVVLKDMKESYPIQVAEYAIASCISMEPAFAWWVNHVLKKRNQIISKVKSKYWLRTHKFGIRIPKTINRILSKVQKSFGSCTHVTSCQKYTLYIKQHILLNILCKVTSNIQESRKFFKRL